ncbi:MAG: CdaR family protein [bacterium]|nr:CdaR family protein [bacterium]
MSKLLKKLFNFFDRFLIMPITRLIYKITKKFSVPNKKFESWLSKQTTLLFLSLFLAIVIFIVVDQKIINFSNQSAEVFKDQPVNIVYNEEQYVVEGLPDTVDVTLVGSKANLYIAKQSSNNGVTVDLTGLTEGTHKVNIKYEHGNSNIEYSVNPSVATVIIYKKVSDTRSLSYDIINGNKLDKTLVVNNVKLSTDEITIRGAEYKLNKVASVKALIDVSNITNKNAGTQTLNDVILKAYDNDGNVVDVEFVPEKVDAEIDLTSPSKKVSLNFVPVGELATGKAIGGYTFSQNDVTIYGDSETLGKIDNLDVRVKLDNLTSNTSFKAEITKPNGVKSMSVNYVTVDLTITDSSSEPIKFSIPLTGINVEEGLTAQPSDKDNGFITVEVQGASSVLSLIDESDITAYVDLAGLGEGTYTKEVIVKGSNPLAIYKAKRTEATVVISKKN